MKLYSEPVLSLRTLAERAILNFRRVIAQSLESFSYVSIALSQSLVYLFVTRESVALAIAAKDSLQFNSASRRRNSLRTPFLLVSKVMVERLSLAETLHSEWQPKA